MKPFLMLAGVKSGLTKGWYFLLKKLIKRILRPLYHRFLKVKEEWRLRADTMRLCKIRGKTKPKIFYFGIVEHSNMGDIAQYYCIERWISENFSNVPVYEFAATTVVNEKYGFLDKLQKLLGSDDIIIFQSGYTTQDLGGVHDLMHRMVIERFPDARIIMMPQTVFFRSEERRELTAITYNLATNMLFLARDRVSFEAAKEMFPDVSVRQFPDIVTTLIGTYSFSSPRSGILLCCRDDGEKLYTDNEISELKSRLSALQKTELTDTTINVPFSEIKKDIGHFLELEIERYSKYRLIITDRYHGTIFSLIANTPVVVLKTNDHKVTTGVQWFENVYEGGVYLAMSLDEAYLLAEQILGREKDHSHAPYFKEAYYDGLKSMALELWSSAKIQNEILKNSERVSRWPISPAQKMSE